MNVKKAVQKIDEKGILLVYPLRNQLEPPSLWKAFFPRSEMRWEWDQGADDRVARLWHLREQVCQSRRAVYAKWYQGRATFFSKKLFPYFLCLLGEEQRLSRSAAHLLRVLEEDSPLSTKELKRRTGMVGRAAEKDYEKSLKELWSQLLIVGCGEVEDGAFPSLALGATSLVFEDLWQQAALLNPLDARQKLAEQLGEKSAFWRHLKKALGTPSADKQPYRKGVIRYEDLVSKS